MAPFRARQHIICLARYNAITRPSVYLSVYPSHGWISQKWLKLGLRNFQHTIPLVFPRKFHPEILTGFHDLAVKQRRGVENKPSEILGCKRIVVSRV